MTARQATTLAALGSLTLLLGAWGFQYIGGLAPCKMCLWQRWPHGLAVLCGLVALRVAPRIVAIIGGFAALATAGIGIYHTGVERDWWEGPTSCTGDGAGLGGLSGGDLLSTADMPGIVMCDQVAWQMLGLSMASWNALASLALAALWFYAATRRSH